MRRLALAAVLAAALPASAHAYQDIFRAGLSDPLAYYRQDSEIRIYRWDGCLTNQENFFRAGGCLRFYGDQGISRTTGRTVIRLAQTSQNLRTSFGVGNGIRVLSVDYGPLRVNNNAPFGMEIELFQDPQDTGVPLNTWTFFSPDATYYELGSIEGDVNHRVRFPDGLTERQTGGVYLRPPGVSVAPEPGTWALVGLGLVGVAGAARRRRS